MCEFPFRVDGFAGPPNVGESRGAARSPGAFNAGFLNPKVRHQESGSPFGGHEPEGLELDAGADLATFGFRVG